MNTYLGGVPVYKWIIAACLVLPQGILLFRDAQKHGGYQWLWGIWGLLSFPMPGIIYLIFVRKIFRKKKI